jgi:protocatechuate 3,4-dioxygenase beta subunit
LKRGGQIGGIVTSSDTGTPLEGVTVYIWHSNQTYVGLARTESSGSYTTPGLGDGSYLVSFDTSFAVGDARDYQNEVYNDQATLDMATPVDVTAPTLTADIDATLIRGATISGTVTTADTNMPLPGVTIELYRDGSWRQSVVTDGQGGYAFRGLASGSYTVRAVPPFNRYTNYAPAYYNNQSQPAQATPVNVTAPQTVGGIDILVQSGGTISGRVTALDTGEGLDTVAINIYDSSGELIRSASADEQGYYQTAGLLDGAYRVQFAPNDPANRYRGEYYADQLSLEQAEPVQVVAPAETTAIDAVLAPQWSLFLPALR